MLENTNRLWLYVCVANARMHLIASVFFAFFWNDREQRGMVSSFASTYIALELLHYQRCSYAGLHYRGVFTFDRLKAHPDYHTGALSQFDLRQFPVLEATLNNLAKTAPNLAVRVTDAFPR